MDKKSESKDQSRTENGQGQMLLVLVLLVSLISPAVFMILTVNAVNQKLSALKSRQSDPGETSESAAEAEKPIELDFYEPMEFLVNLEDQEQSHYLRTTLSLAIPHSEEGTVKSGGHGSAAVSPLVAKLKPKEPIIRDTVISVISSRPFRELSTSAGKNMLKETLRQRLLEELKMENLSVYFTAFTLQ